MSIPVLICDDSTLARKRLARSLPDALAGDVRFARHGREALSQLHEKSTQLLFLDLTMPEMDGYETLAAIRADGIQVRVIVVSGDIQPTAHQRVMDLGAIAFIKKPIAADTLQQVLQGLELTAAAGPTATGRAAIAGEVIRRRDVYQEVASVAMGRAADSLARLLGVHVQLPIPNVNIFEVSELHMALHSVGTGESTSGVCQGFIGEGIAGEALLILTDSSVRSLARLMRYQGEVNADTERELLLDLSNILIGAFLNGLGEQMDLRFSQGHPMVLGQHRSVTDLIHDNQKHWRRTLTFEISYGLEGVTVQCDLLLLFTEDSVGTLNNKLSYLMDD